MTIECRRCHHIYDSRRGGEFCPQCGAENKVFRSAMARNLAGYEEELSGHFSKERRERYQVPDPYRGKSAFRRVAPQFKIIVLVCSVAFLGQVLIGFAQGTKTPPPAASQTQALEGQAHRPPILELASAAFDLRFPPRDGIELAVTCTGTLPQAPELSQELKEGQKFIFINLYATVTDRQALRETDFAAYFLLDGQGRPYSPKNLSGKAEALGYTPFAPQALAQGESSVSGQLFFAVPQELEEFSFLEPGGGNTGTGLPLHL